MADVRPNETEAERPIPEVREAHDGTSHEGLNANPPDDDAKLDIALDETLPTSEDPENRPVVGL